MRHMHYTMCMSDSRATFNKKDHAKWAASIEEQISDILKFEQYIETHETGSKDYTRYWRDLNHKVETLKDTFAYNRSAAEKIVDGLGAETRQHISKSEALKNVITRERSAPPRIRIGNISAEHVIAGIGLTIAGVMIIKSLFASAGKRPAAPMKHDVSWQSAINDQRAHHTDIER
jgi:hypothetical protein